MSQGSNKQTLQIGGGGGGGSSNDKGFFATSTALSTTYPTGSNGWYATVGTTDTLWIWDSDTSAWKDSGANGATVTASNGLTKTGNNVKLGGTLTESTTVDTTGQDIFLIGPGARIVLDDNSSTIDVIGEVEVRVEGKDYATVSGAETWIEGRTHLYMQTPSVYTKQAGDVLKLVSPSTAEVEFGPPTGEANTASNVGTGIGVFKQKVNANLEFNSIKGNTKIPVTYDVLNSQVNIDIVEENFTGIPQSAVTNLEGDLAGKAPTVHGHAITDVTGLQTALDGKSSTGHTHSDATTTVPGFMSASDKTKLDGIASGAEVNVNADWNATSGDAQILNKPTIPTQYTDEMAQDAIGSLITDSNTIDATYNDAGNVETLDVKTQMSVTSDASGVKLAGDATTPGANQVYGTNGSGVKGWKSDPAGGGEANTASNVGTAGVGVYKQKIGVNHEFKKINAGSSKVTITDDTANSEIDIDVSLVKGDVGLGNVDNTSDANKPISTATQTALDNKLDDSQATAFGLSLLDDANASEGRTTLGLATIASSGALSDATGTITDSQHGNRGGGALHAVATDTTAGFMSSADKAKLNNLVSPWVQAYLPIYSVANLPIANVPWHLFTHLAYFSVAPTATGGVVNSPNGNMLVYMADLVKTAHSKGKKVLITIGGGAGIPEADWRGAVSSANRATFVANIVSYLNTHNLDGIDLDWEPFNTQSDSTDFGLFIADLRTALGTSKIITIFLNIGPAWKVTFANSIKQHIDRFGLSTYDLAYSSTTVAIHDSPLYSGGGQPAGLSAVDAISTFVTAGVPKEKLCIAIPQYARHYTSATALYASATHDPNNTTAYKSLTGVTATTAPTGEVYDATAKGAYTISGGTLKTYNNPATVYAKMDYVRTNNIGGVIIWQLEQGYFAGATEPFPVIAPLAGLVGDGSKETVSAGATNLGYTPSATNGIVTSDTGTDATIPLGNGTNSGLSLNDYTTAEKNKLAGIATGATAYTDELAQDAVGGILVDSSEIDFTYNDATPSITASLVVGSIDETKLDASVNASLDLADTASQPGHTQTASTISDFAEASQDVVGAMMTDSATLDFTYDDTAGTLTGIVKPDSIPLNNLSDVVITSPTTGQVLKWNGTTWVNDTDAGGGGGVTDGDKGDVIVSSSGTVWTVEEPTLRKSETSVNNSPLFTTINKFDTIQTNFYGNGTVALETTIEAEGTGCMKLTLATAGVCGPRLTLASATNFLRKSFTIKCRASAWANISTAEIMFATEAGFTNFYLWQWKGASNPKLVSPPDGEWIERVFSPGDCMVGSGTPNWSAITHIIIRAQASSGTPDFYVDDFKYFGNTQKPFVACTYDDGLLTQFTNGKAKLDQYDIKGTFYVIHNELTPGTNMETSHHKILSSQGHDIGGHGGTNLTTLSSTDRVTDLRAMKKYLISNGFRGSNHYALPNGGYNDAVLDDVRDYFNSIANIDWLSNTPEYSPAYLINRFSPDSGTSTATIQAWIDMVIANGGCAVIAWHGIVASGATGAQVTQATYDTIMDYIGTKKNAGAIDTGTLTDYYARPIIPDALVTRVIHGATAGTARPPVSYVEWVGSVEPTNATNNDTWLQTP